VEKDWSSSSGMNAERSEAPVSSPNRRARGESREGNGGGVGSVSHRGRKMREREGAARQRGPRGRDGSMWRGRRLANRGGRRGTDDTARLTGGAGWQLGPMSAVGCGRERVSDAAQWWAADRGARPAQCLAARFKLGFKPIQKYSNGSNEI
jgi:hypothetical protein